MSRTAVLLLCGCLSLAGVRADASVTDARIQEGIDRLVALLYDLQNDHGHWDTTSPRGTTHQYGMNYGGTTALVTYALLWAGESYQDPRLERAIRFLRNVRMEGTYAVALRAHVWGHLPDSFRPYLQRDAQWLREAQHSRHGHYNYTAQPREGYDNSTTQYGVLGMWEAAKRGLHPGRPYWRRVEEHFLDTQQPDGGWNYRRAGRTRGSMVAAGLAALYITQDYLHRDDFRSVGRTPDHPVQQQIDRGLDWFARNFRPNTNPGFGQHVHYYLYGVERVGLASGIKYFAGHNWYVDGARWLLEQRTRDPVEAAFSLLFLVRGSYPVLANKLQIEGHHWNNRPRDLARLAEWVSDQGERQLLWQVVSLDHPAEEWLDAPLLYIAGHEPLTLSESQSRKIGRFIDLGGMLVTTADVGSLRFSRSVEQLLERLYPDHRLRPLRSDDDLGRVVFDLPDEPFGARTLHNGVRHLALHIPEDVSWTLHSADRSDPTPWKLLMNAYYYATEKGRRQARLDTPYVERQETVDGPSAAVRIGRGRYDGNWDPEPLAWELQSNFMHNHRRIQVELEPLDLHRLPESPGRVPFVHVAGTEAIRFSASEREAIRRYTEAGGVILFENVGGRGRFADSVLEMLREEGWRPRPLNRRAPPIDGESFDGEALDTVTYRPYTVVRMGQIRTPRLVGAMVDQEPRLLVSGEDLSVGMLGQPIWGLFGYSPDSARRIVSNLVLWAASDRPREAPVAAEASHRARSQADVVPPEGTRSLGGSR